MKKKEGYRKIQIAEFKKKKIDDEMKKNNLEEEENKKKLHMQKIFDEWENNKILQKKREKEEKDKQNLFNTTKINKEKEKQQKRDKSNIKNDSNVFEKIDPISVRDLRSMGMGIGMGMGMGMDENEKLRDLTPQNNALLKTMESTNNNKFVRSGPPSKWFKDVTLSPLTKKNYKNQMNMTGLLKRRSLDIDVQGTLNRKYENSTTNRSSPVSSNVLAKPYIFLPRINPNNFTKTELLFIFQLFYIKIFII